MEEFEQTVVQFNQLVQAQCDREAAVEEHGADPAAAVRRRRMAARLIIAELRAQLHVVRGEWNECAQQHLAALRGMAERGLSLEQKNWLLRLWRRIAAALRLERLFSSEPGLNVELEMAAKFAALSHARLMQPSPAHSAAVLDAQHAVALLGVREQADKARMLNQVRAVVDAEAELGATASPSERVGDVHYRDLLSATVLARVRQQEAAIQDLASGGVFTRALERLWLIESSKVRRERAHARLSQIAAVYQQLGLALEETGEKEEAQRAFDFADEMAAMRPAVSDRLSFVPASAAEPPSD